MNNQYTGVQSSPTVNGITQFMCQDGVNTEQQPDHNDANEQKFNEFIERASNQEQPTAESLLKNFSEEERQFKIVDLNNSCVYDVRNDEDIEKLSTMDTSASSSSSSSTPAKFKKPSWEDFWKNVKRCNIELIDAAEIGNIDKIRFLLDKSQNLFPVDLNYPSLDQYTPLHFALAEKNNDIARLLIVSGASIEAETQFKRRPIHLCCIFGNLEGVEILIDKKANLNAQDNSQKTPILFATEGKYPEIVDLLLKNGADPLLKDSNGLNAVEACKDQGVFDVFQSHNYEPPALKPTEPELSDLKRELSRITEETKINDDDVELIYGDNENRRKTVQDYDYYRILGSGSFGKVILVREKHSLKYYAMKIISKEKFTQLNLMKYAHSEKNAMNKMHHPFIVQLHHAFQTNRKLILIQAYCGGGSLGRMLKIKNKFDEETAKKYLCQIILAIEALHDNQIIFRDLKPDNIVLDDDGNAYIVDFGLAKLNAYDDITKSFLGTPAYLPPEIVQKDGHNRMADWYAVGIVLYELLMGNTPFNQGNVSREVLYERIKQNVIKLPSNLSASCQDIIKQLLCKHPKKRLGAKEDGKEVRSHPWFNGVDWDKVMQKKIPMPKPVIRAIPAEPLDVKFNEECEKEINVDNWTEINQD